MSLTAKYHTRCLEGCGGLINPGDDIYLIDDDRIHVRCLPAYELRLAEKAKARQPKQQNLPPRAVEMSEHRCGNCGARYAGPTDQVVDRCRVPSWQLGGRAEALDPPVCGGVLLDGDGDEWPPGPIAPWAELPGYLRTAWERYWAVPDPDTGQRPARPSWKRIQRGAV